VPPYHILVYAIARITALALVGAELCENDEWVGQSIQTTIQVIMASQSVKGKWHPWFRWIAKYYDEPTKVVVQNRKRAAELLAPVLEKRKATTDLKSKVGQLQYQDAVQWLLEQYRGQGKTLTPELLAQDELFLTIASTHSTGGTTLSTLFDLIDRPEAMKEIIEEINRTYAKHNGWSRQALNELWLLDSFMRESQRVHSLGLGKPIFEAL
jgi:ent-kaurene oxidase